MWEVFRARELKDTTGKVGISAQAETWCKGSSLESTKMMPAKIPSNRGYILNELTISSNLAKLLVEGLAHEPGHNFQPTVCPAYRMCWYKGGTEFVGVANQ